MKEQSVWNEGFGAAFRPYFDLMPRKATSTWVKLAVKHLKLTKGSRFLDCPCGPGRISIPLAKKGVTVTGVDINPEYLAELDAKAQRGKLPITVRHGDMRRLKFRDEFDAAANLYTSIGYFESDRDNQAVINGAFRALKSGGRYMLDTSSRDWFIRNHVYSNWDEKGDFRLLQRRTFDFRRSLETCKWTFLRDGREETYEVKLRWFSLHELVAMFEKAGFEIVTTFSGFDEKPVGFDQTRIFVVGEKP